MRAVVFACLAGLSFWASGAQADVESQRMFERIKGLGGDWRGTYRWSGAREGGGEIRAQYSLTGAGSAVIENLIQGGRVSMTSVYHLDEGKLRMTHYCAAGNQPRLRQSRVDEASGVVEFAFADVTNVAGPDAGYVEAMKLRLVNDHELVIEFIFEGGGPRAVETIVLRRQAEATGPGTTPAVPGRHH